MVEPKPTGRNAARTRAQSHFAAAEQRDQTIKQMLDAERTATSNKTAKLRALRLAKEDADRLASAATVAAAPPKRTKIRIAIKG